MRLRRLGITMLLILLGGCLIPETPLIPVKGASSKDWNSQTFWYEPWGASGVHKGIDIFAPKNTAVIAPTPMLVIYRGDFFQGGKVVVGLGPKWQIHYFAHLANIAPDTGLIATKGDTIGAVGDTGNAQGKPAHLHYSILSLLPKPWLIDASTQGYKKAVYQNPIEYLKAQ
ncbi:M23 family metallopeptidase [Shewanella sp. HN-41]|uniref:M23 family metallopeptidase n=1 Tax=Shewanella sp. HN-41 TaxID=327275 RepID=UPI0002125ABD|nr:M23 family metallopeptidase [Shewanella sp. HN-41]EGM68270.1 peptidase family M23/M37 [Shewanella sp. HN-41]